MNTHRLLVRGERVEDREVVERATAVAAGPPASPGFPWWAVAILGTGLASSSLARLATPVPQPAAGVGADRTPGSRHGSGQAAVAPRRARRRAQKP